MCRIRPVDRRAGHTYWRVFASWLLFAEARLCSWSDYYGNGQTACIQIAAAAAPASSVPMARVAQITRTSEPGEHLSGRSRALLRGCDGLAPSLGRGSAGAKPGSESGSGRMQGIEHRAVTRFGAAQFRYCVDPRRQRGGPIRRGGSFG